MVGSETPIGRVRDAFCLSLFHGAAAVQRDAAALLRGERVASARMSEQLHRIAGTSASLGLEALGQRARALESSLEANDDRWHGHLFDVCVELELAAAPFAPALVAMDRPGVNRSGFFASDEPLPSEALAISLLRAVSTVEEAPSPPRGVLLVDARRDLMSRVRAARARWGPNPVVAVLPESSVANTLLALRAGADLVHRGPLDAGWLGLSRIAALPPALSGAGLLWVDRDPLRASSLRAALEPLGARVTTVDDIDQLPRALRSPLPHMAIVDVEHVDAAAILDRIEESTPTVELLTVGPAPAGYAWIPSEGGFLALVQRVGQALASALGPDDPAPFDARVETQTLELSRRELGDFLRQTRR